MSKTEPVDLEKFFFFLCENPFVDKKKKQFREEDIYKINEDIKREYYNNLRWKNKTLEILIKNSSEHQKNLSKAISWNGMEKQITQGLDVWM